MKEFDDIFKSALSNREAEVPDDMWSRIEGAQESTDRALPITKIIILSLSSFLILSLIAGIIVSQVSDSNVIKPFENKAEEKLAVKLNTGEEYRSLLLPSLDSGFGSSVKEGNLLSTSFKQANESKTSKTKVTAFADKQVLEDVAFAKSQISSIEIQNSNKKPSTTKKKQEVKSSMLIANDFHQLYFEVSRENKIFPDYDNKCPKFGRQKTGYFSVEGYHATDFNLRTIDAKSSEFENYANRRNETESSRYSFTDGIKLKWHSYSGISVGAGVERSQINERFEFENENAREVKVLISIDTLFMPDGTFTTSGDTTRIELMGVKLNDIYNKYTSIDLPINLSYQIELKRWAIALNAGVNINLLFNQKGRVLDAFDKPQWISTGASNELDIFRSKSGIKFDGSVSLLYHLTSNIDILAEPYFKYNPNSLSRNDYQLDMKYNTIGIRTGVRYNLSF